MAKRISFTQWQKIYSKSGKPQLYFCWDENDKYNSDFIKYAEIIAICHKHIDVILIDKISKPSLFRWFKIYETPYVIVRYRKLIIHRIHGFKTMEILEIADKLNSDQVILYDFQESMKVQRFLPNKQIL